MKSEKKSIFKKIKELMANPRYKALITLGAYLIFFLVIYIYITVKSNLDVSKMEAKVDPIYNYQNMESYEYEYNITSTSRVGSKATVINGTHASNKDIFNVSLHKFTIDNNVVVGDTDIALLIPFDIIDTLPSNMEALFVSDYLENKTSYNNGDTKMVFSIPFKNFNILKIDDDSIDNLFSEVKVSVEDDVITSISIDLSSAISLVDKNIVSYVIDIKYSNINAIKSLEEF